MNRSSSSSVAQDWCLKLKQEQQADQQGSGAKNCLELRLGIFSSSDSGCSPWPVDPWSLAATWQEKASVSLEKARHQRPPDECDLQSPAAAPPQPPVGWPPVRAFRKNLSSGSKPADGLLFSSSKAKPGSDEDRDKGHGAGAGGERPMFVKVNLEGCAVGRKVDLRAHRGYGSLSRALQSMFRGFLLLSDDDGQWRLASNKEEDEEDEEQQQQPEKTKTKGTTNKAFILLYEDNEGDRMLVGDVPWELFVSSVKRLYIAQDARP